MVVDDNFSMTGKEWAAAYAEVKAELRLEAKARRAAKRAGMKAIKSPERSIHINNLGGFMLIDPVRNWVVAGSQFELTAQEVIDRCGRRE
jgi:hypothetical protein